MSPAKRRAQSARLRKERQQNARRGHVRMEIEKRKPRRVIAAGSVAEFVARGGVIEVLPPFEYANPTAIPMRQSFRGKGNQG